MSNYLDETQRREIEALAQSLTARTEWPTWLLLIGVYAGWFAVILGSAWLGVWLSTLLLIPLVALWLSLQHELLHGHPTRFIRLNKNPGHAPFAVWYPYTLYRDSHLLHHNDEDLTVPGVDPESRYLNQVQWAASSLFERGLHWLTKTVVGRFLLGSPLSLWKLARNELQAPAPGPAPGLVDVVDPRLTDGADAGLHRGVQRVAGVALPGAGQRAGVVGGGDPFLL